jgi:mannosyltransferase
MATLLHTPGANTAAPDVAPATRGFAGQIALISTAATVVSLTGSWIPSLWGDEAASIMSASRSLPSLFRMLGTVDAVHGTYYLGLHFWIQLFGTSPFSVRFPSALAVGATVAAVMLLCRSMNSRRIAIAAGIICAVIPRVTYMGAEARSSACAAAIAAWLTVLLMEILRRHDRPLRLWFTYGALLAVGMYVFLYLGLIAVAHAAILLTARVDRRVLTHWALSVTAAIATATPVVFWALREREQVAFLAHRFETTVARLTVSLWFGQPLFAVVAWTLIACACVAALLAGRRADSDAKRMLPNSPRLDVVAAAWLFIPAGILIGGGALLPLFAPRYLSFCAPAAAILMALGLDWAVRGRSRAMTAGLISVVLCAAPLWVSQRQPHAKNNSDFADTSAIIATHAVRGDAVVFDESVRPSRRPRLAVHLYPPAFAGLRDVTLDVPYDAGTSWHDTAYDVLTAAALGRFDGVTRVWLVEHSGPGGADTADMRALEKLGYVGLNDYETHRSVILEYVRP